MNNYQKQVFIFVLSLLIFIILVLYVFSSEHRVSPTRKHVEILKEMGVNGKNIRKLAKDDKSWFYDNINTCVGPLIDRDCSEFNSLCPKSIYQECVLLKEAIQNRGTHRSCPLLY